ncbi:MAG: hypothetical protein ACK4ZY_00020 [Sphingomonas sp.]
MGLPADYLAVLEHLGRAFAAYKAATSIDPVLVGGAAVALGTAGTFMSSDFDVIARRRSVRRGDGVGRVSA